MKRRDEGPTALSGKARVYMAILGVAILMPGLAALLLGAHSYTDYRGLVVFAPATIVVGALVMLIAIKKGKKAAASRRTP